MRIQGIAAALAAGLLIGAAPAAALDDLTGTYAMKLSCRNIDSGVKNKFKVVEDFVVADEGNGAVRFETMGFGPGRAFLLSETAKPDIGALSGMTCAKSAFDLNGLIVRLDVNSKAADPTLKGTLLIFGNLGSNSATCKFSAKRVSLGPVKVLTCTV